MGMRHVDCSALVTHVDDAHRAAPADPRSAEYDHLAVRTRGPPVDQGETRRPVQPRNGHLALAESSSLPLPGADRRASVASRSGWRRAPTLRSRQRSRIVKPTDFPQALAGLAKCVGHVRREGHVRIRWLAGDGTGGNVRQSPADGPGGRLGPGFDAEFGEDVGDVRGGGAGRDEQRRRDLTVGVSGCDRPHLPFPCREAEGCLRALGALAR